MDNCTKTKRGLFVTFEGCEGCGKTTLINTVVPLLREKGINPIVTREPGGSKISEEIRKILLDPDNKEMTKETETLLYAASRAQHLAECVLPDLMEGRLVICDRYLDSSLAYQGYARGVGVNVVKDVNTFATHGTFPDLTFLIDLRPEIGLERIRQGRAEKIDRLDNENLYFHQMVYEGYLELYKGDLTGRMVLIDGNDLLENKAKKVVRKIIATLKGENTDED